MKTSARNVFEGRIRSLSSGPVSAEIEIGTAGGDSLIATITQGSVSTLGLEPGTEVVALVKASNVMIMTEGSSVKLSARNCLHGRVTKVVQGPVSTEVALALPGGAEIFASITRDAARELALREGLAATAVIKASAVIVGVRN